MYSKYTVKRGMDEEGGVYDRGACEGVDVVREQDREGRKGMHIDSDERSVRK